MYIGRDYFSESRMQEPFNPPVSSNIGVRIEDVILVTPEGNTNLSEGSSREISAIERLMKKKGIGNQQLR